MSWKVSLDIETNSIEVSNSYNKKIYGNYEVLPSNRCSKCGLPGYKDIYCPFCADFEYVNQIYSIGIYYPRIEDVDHGILSTHIRRLKRWKDCAWPIGASLYLLMTNLYNNLNYDIIVPLPVSERKISERGYNQAEEIAKVVSVKTKIPLGNIIRKIKDVSMNKIENGQSMPLSRAERYAAVRGAYVCDAPLSGKKILLIDDVVTSGANSQQCSKILISRGAESVELIVAGRTREPTLNLR